jgi:hypothetical protein
MEVTSQRDLLREMVSIMQDHLTPNGRLAFEKWKADRTQQIAAEMHVKLMEGQSDGTT